jgi:diguanylate cyclase (GGDEF)-like protein/PAS domain S-box-containing protein
VVARRLYRPGGDVDDETLVVKLERLLETNRRLLEEFERHKESELAWRAERALLMALVNQVPDYLFAKDFNGKFLVANRAVAGDLGFSEGEDIVGLTDFDMQPDPEVARKFREDDLSVLESGRPKLDIEEYLVGVDGETKWLSTSKVPLVGEDGNVIGLVGVARDVTERKRAQDQIQFIALHDPLTGLPNRFQFEKKLAEALVASRASAPAALLYLDLDRFKTINDTLGHPAGDELIRQVGARLRAVTRSTDTVARLGGDEFAIVMAGIADPGEAELFSRRILAELSHPFDLFGNQAYVNASIGLALAGDVPADGSEMLRRADIALYRAKARGRGRYEIFADSMADALIETSQIEQDLRSALLTGTGLYALYQPVFDAATTEMVGAEALVRWDHPQRGTLAPSVFVGVAEERGLIEALGQHVLSHACTTAREAELPWVAVNVSPAQIRNTHFAEAVLDTLGSARLDPHRLQIEITEGTLLESTEAVHAALSQLRASGVRIALDDFGTGYSSLNYLRRYNIDKLKIDRSFVSQLGSSDDTGAIVAAMIALAKAMRMKVTAEGVETEAQREALVALGCGELQGFLLSRPLTNIQLAEITRKPH